MNIFYLGFRLSPFIIVSFFVLQSILNWDLKGLIYLVGLVVCTIVIILLNSPMHFLFHVDNNIQKPINVKCTTITLGDGEHSTISDIPLSISVFSYTFAYLLTFIIYLGGMSSLQQNIPMLILFPLLFCSECFWLCIHNCIIQPYFFITCSMIVSSIIGIGWAMIIISTKNNDLMYASKNGNDVCSRPSKTMFKCKPKQIIKI